VRTERLRQKIAGLYNEVAPHTVELSYPFCGPTGATFAYEILAACDRVRADVMFLPEDLVKGEILAELRGLQWRADRLETVLHITKPNNVLLASLVKKLQKKLRDAAPERYERGSMILTSNLPFTQWDQTFGATRR
jgi:hypothetical protein